MKHTVILASASPRRAELLAEMGYHFDVLPPELDEQLDHRADPAEEAIRLAAAKAKEVAARTPPSIIVAADTVVALRGRIIGKPLDHAHAREILRRLSGSRHHVITGLCVFDSGTGKTVTESVSTAVTMKPITEEQIREYVHSGEANGKAGAYAIQETADQYVLRVEGSFTNVVGLPTERLGEILESFGAERSP